VVFYNDHGLNFFLDKMPTFAVGAAAEYSNADEGWGIPTLPSTPGCQELSWHIINRLIADEFDIVNTRGSTSGGNLNTVSTVAYMDSLSVWAVNFPPPADLDGDGVPDGVDNCLAAPNPTQADCDGNGIGDACQPDSRTSIPMPSPTTASASRTSPPTGW